MSILLRQLVAALVVTIVSAGLAVSTAKAATALDCESALMRVVPAEAIAAGADLHRHDQHRHDQSAVAVTDYDAHGHEDRDNDGGTSDADASHCEAHACPSSAITAFTALTPFVDMGQSLTVLSAGSLVELTVPDGLRRPPRG